MYDHTVKVTKHCNLTHGCSAMKFRYEKSKASQGIQLEAQEKEHKMKDVQLFAASLQSSAFLL